MKIGDTQNGLIHNELQQVKKVQETPEENEAVRKEDEVTGLSTDEKSQNKAVSTINSEVQKTQETVIRQQLEQEAETTVAGIQAEGNTATGLEEEQESQNKNEQNSVLNNEELLNSDSVAAIQAVGNIDLRG